MLLAALAVGLLVSIFQAATQINEMTLSFIPKLVAVFVTMIVAGPWILSTLIDYIRRLFMQIPTLIG
jgi:flagellar biosynthetic protein FliQ